MTMSTHQISKADTTKLLKDGIKSGNTIKQAGFKLPDDVVNELGVDYMEELGEWYPEEFKILMSGLKAKQISPPVVGFKKLELAAAMIRAWQSCEVPLEVEFFSPKRMEIWKTY